MTREHIIALLENTILADGFVGFSEEEWNGAKKIIATLLNIIRTPSPSKGIE